MGGLGLFDGVGGGPDQGAWSVADLTRRARQLIESGMASLWVRGEVTGLKQYSSGHWYFGLRDETAQVRCVMWRSDNRRLEAPPEEGASVFVEGRPTVWEEKGEFRLTVRRMLATAEGGVWQLQLERARAALERDGLLDPARKRRLPRFPQRIAVVTSPDGAALRDIVAVTGRRWPAIELWVVPSRVQGEGAVEELCAALALVNRLPGVDLAIVGRGGGGREDLWAFNDERVARAVAAVRVPTISAVGHETDVALTDLVADVRAATPSAAAEAAVPDAGELRAALAGLARRLARGLTRQSDLGRERVERTADRLTSRLQRVVERAHRRLERAGASLNALSPLAVLERGYAVARGKGGEVLKRVAQLPVGGEFRLTVADGTVGASVTEGGP